MKVLQGRSAGGSAKRVPCRRGHNSRLRNHEQARHAGGKRRAGDGQEMIKRRYKGEGVWRFELLWQCVGSGSQVWCLFVF